MAQGACESRLDVYSLCNVELFCTYCILNQRNAPSLSNYNSNI
jgi:hypothetical protein